MSSSEHKFTIDDLRKAFEGGRDSVEASLGYDHYDNMAAYPKKKIVKSFKQFMHENYRHISQNKTKQDEQ